ncbi:MAG TPA: sigma factor [Phycisphaerae bacterium]|nr:sigma factor [Phycisphaerae bacterium]HRW55297.1 sigma factor [Phycisphaerae bacterium]
MISELTRTTTILLEGLHDPGNAEAWGQLHRRCFPMLVAYARRKGLQAADAEDAAQEALADFANAYRRGQYERDRGRLRQWLYGFAARRIEKIREGGRKAGQPINSAGRTEFFDQIVAPDQLDEIWEEEWERHVLNLCQDQIRREFDPGHVQAFEAFAIEGRPAAEVAASCGMTANAVYICKTRILTRLRELQSELAEIW